MSAILGLAELSVNKLQGGGRVETISQSLTGCQEEEQRCFFGSLPFVRGGQVG